ncbi:unnamed protein product, partial [Prorocentrum cordatum]
SKSRYDVHSLGKNPTVKDAFRNRFEFLATQELHMPTSSIDDTVDRFEAAVAAAVKDTVPSVRATARRPWISKEAVDQELPACEGPIAVEEVQAAVRKLKAGRDALQVPAEALKTVMEH